MMLAHEQDPDPAMRPDSIPSAPAQQLVSHLFRTEKSQKSGIMLHVRVLVRADVREHWQRKI